MRLPVAEDWNCFTTRLKYRLEPKKLAQQRFDAWRECEDPYRMQRSVITSINGFYLIHRTGMIPSMLGFVKLLLQLFPVFLIFEAQFSLPM